MSIKRKPAKLFLVLLAAAVMAAMASPVFAMDPPHDPDNLVNCNSCHTIMGAAGSDLTTFTKNADLCMDCHNSGGTASNVAFTNSMQAKPGLTIGISHAWNGTMPEFSNPANAYGLRNTGDLVNGTLKSQLVAYDNVVTCGVCHGQHTQKKKPWDPDSSQTYTAGTSSDRHFLRTENDYNQMCEDCHYYRAMTYAQAKDESIANGTTVFSHPVSDILNSTDYDFDAPRDADGAAQTGSPRFAGDTDGNSENNLVLDSNKKVRCLSCHRMHYVDSNSLSDSADVRP